jgi:hypothetical protein
LCASSPHEKTPDDSIKLARPKTNRLEPGNTTPTEWMLSSPNSRESLVLVPEEARVCDKRKKELKEKSLERK